MRGRRYARRRRTGTVLIAGLACLVLVALATLTWFRAAPPVHPAPAGPPSSIPDHVYLPGRWLGGTDEAGPLGTLIAIFPAERATLGARTTGVVAVSAEHDDYRVLDLPHGLTPYDERVALSPDGRRVAYWYSGPTQLGPGGQAFDPTPPAVGFAVYDAVTGETTRHHVPSDHGLVAHEIGWVDASTVFASYAPWEDERDDRRSARNFMGPEQTVLWQPGSSLVALPETWSAQTRQQSDTSRVSLLDDQGRLGVLESVEPLRVRVIPLDLDSRFIGPVVLDEQERRAATLSGYHETADGGAVQALPSDVRVATIPGDTYQRAPGTKGSYEVIRWLGDEIVVSAAGPEIDGDHYLYAEDVKAVDATTGDARLLLRVEDVGMVQLATDLLGLPTHPGRPAPHPLDGWLVIGLALLTSAAAALALVRWRRRVRP